MRRTSTRAAGNSRSRTARPLSIATNVGKAKWPCDWVNGVDYPHKDGRGTVTGRLVLDDPQAKTRKLPGGKPVALSHMQAGTRRKQ